ncbi:MAG: hypothetical protein EAY75_07005 [Bacteroidetes bacterium]|nr:MAG: hypothetical protein EAY75_07005 [Bacteroidota bacterium]
MESYLQQFYDWSEFWALLIPIGVLALRRQQPLMLRPVLVYLWCALVINLVCDIIGDNIHQLPTWAASNTPLYNLHSVLRYGCFTWFFLKIGSTTYPRLQKVLVMIYVVLMAVNFLFVEHFFDTSRISSNAMTTEAFMLLANCMLYYFGLLNQNDSNYLTRKDFWVVTGLAVFVVVNFFVFLFYEPLVLQEPDLAEWMWNVHNLAYIIFCIFMAKALYVPYRN